MRAEKHFGRTTDLASKAFTLVLPSLKHSCLVNPEIVNP
jgi:hypothetical protein